MALFTLPLSVREINGMTVSVYPQLTLIERDGHRKRYIGYPIKMAVRLFRNEFPKRKNKQKHGKN
jgi:hypothetical protein